MSKKSFRYGGMPFQRFVSSINCYYPTFFRSPPLTEQPGVRVTKTFVIRQSISPFQSRSGEARTGTDAQDGTIQRILVFDDHPDSLRLVFGQSASPKANRPATAIERWWEPILGGLLITGALILVFLPLFLKLPS
jgi:hypothetical protein